jgi:hypothetical protein
VLPARHKRAAGKGAPHLRLQQHVGLEAATQLHDRAYELQHARVLAHIVHFTHIYNHCTRDAAAVLGNFVADSIQRVEKRRVAGLAADGGGAFARRATTQLACQHLERLKNNKTLRAIRS